MAMKRHPALRQLSSDHHTGLVLARKAREAAKGAVQDPRYAWTTLVARFQAELEPHFAVEEKGLLVALWRAGETDLVERTLTEHEDMRSLIAQDRPENLARFAELLTAHIRFEEQTLFARAQELLEPDQLSELVIA
ncbi:MAG: hemerythrin domain-containing protein [Chromatiales bacterium]|nr:hemerythrin domain-containing protein [Chromatiales bacterium]